MKSLARLFVVLALCSACSIRVPGQATRAPLPVPRADLPFTPAVEGRLNDRNNGSTFEPCIAYSDDELTAIGIKPATRRDAAMSESPNYRGCHWDVGASSTVSQIVTNQGSLADYLRHHGERQWRLAATTTGRTVAIGDSRFDDGCSAVFKSQGAIVVSHTPIWNGDIDSRGACGWVIEFAALAAGKAP